MTEIIITQHSTSCNTNTIFTLILDDKEYTQLKLYLKENKLIINYRFKI